MPHGVRQENLRVNKAVKTGLKTVEEVIQAGAMADRSVPLKHCFKIARDLGIKNAKACGDGVANVARHIKVSAIAVNAGINKAIEGGCMMYNIHQAKKRYKKGKITKEEFELQRMKLGGET